MIFFFLDGKLKIDLINLTNYMLMKKNPEFNDERDIKEVMKLSEISL